MTHLPRRDFLIRLTVLSATPAALVACSGGGSNELSCTSTQGLSGAEVQMRTAQAYTDHSTRPQKCSDCNFYTAATQPNTCGGCQVLRGPIHPDGYCNLFAARPS